MTNRSRVDELLLIMNNNFKSVLAFFDHLLFGVFIQNSVTISRPGGSISTMCSESVFTEIFERNIRQVIVMAGTNNLFDKKNKRLMGPVETSDELFYLIQKLKFYRLHVSILELISRRGKAETYARVNYCYRDVARELNVPFVTLKKFKAVKHLTKMESIQIREIFENLPLISDVL